MNTLTDITGTPSTAEITQPARQVTVAQYPSANPNFSRNIQVNDQFVMVKRGSNSFGISLADLAKAAVAQVPQLSWSPRISTQPDNSTCTFANTVLLAENGNASDGDTVTLGSTVYRFKTTMAQAFDVQIGTSISDSLNNLSKAINLTGTAGTEYYTGTTIHPSVTADSVTAVVIESVSIPVLYLHAKTIGTSGNSIASSATGSTFAFNFSTFQGGTNAAVFSVVADTTDELTPSYQWQYSDDGVNWTNCSGTVNDCTYTNPTTANLTCTPTTNGQSGVKHRCVLTNGAGSTNSKSAVLNILLTSVEI